jgi:hypothetical protein
MKPYYKSTEFWFVVASLYFWPLAVAGYNLSRGIAKYSARFKDGMVTTEAYLSLVGLLVVYVRHLSPYIGAGLSRGYLDIGPVQRAECPARGFAAADF